jgi:uncharacterized membrane protein HdeD (DUF308 family)
VIQSVARFATARSSRAFPRIVRQSGWIGLLIGLVFSIVSPWTAWPVISATMLGTVLGII